MNDDSTSPRTCEIPRVHSPSGRKLLKAQLRATRSTSGESWHLVLSAVFMLVALLTTVAACTNRGDQENGGQSEAPPAEDTKEPIASPPQSQLSSPNPPAQKNNAAVAAPVRPRPTSLQQRAVRPKTSSTRQAPSRRTRPELNFDCDFFEVGAYFRGDDLFIEVETDLPPTLDVSIQIIRSYLVWDDPEIYTQVYRRNDEGLTQNVERWREGVWTFADNDKWVETLRVWLIRKQTSWDTPDSIERISSTITIRAAVSHSQSDPRYSKSVLKFAGNAVLPNTSTVEASFELSDPLGDEALASLLTYELDPRKLRVGVTYKATRPASAIRYPSKLPQWKTTVYRGYTYDVMNQMLTSPNPDGTYQKYTYDKAGTQISSQRMYGPLPEKIVKRPINRENENEPLDILPGHYFRIDRRYRERDTVWYDFEAVDFKDSQGRVSSNELFGQRFGIKY